MRGERELPGEGCLPEDLDRLVPGVGLAAVLEKLTGLEPPSGAAGAGGTAVAGGPMPLDALADEELGDVVAGWERVASWVRAAQARAAAFTALVTGRIVLPCTDDDDSDTTDDPDGSESARLVEPVLDTDLIPLPDDPDGVALTGPTSVPGSAFPSPAVEGARLRVVEVPATVNVTVPATMLLDPQDATPGMLEGIGPIPADEAARLAAGGTWRRLLTDPVTGVLTDYSTRSYKPGAVLRAAVTARDQACTFPGCDRPARSGGRSGADLDHIEAFDPDHRYGAGEPGQTRATNLHPLCRRHHNLKTHAKWQVTRDPETGTTRWTAPTGTATGIAPTVVDPAIRYGLTRGLTLAAPPDQPTASSATEPPASGPPPF